MKRCFHYEDFMNKIVKSSQITEIALNSAYNTEDELERLVIQGIPARWMSEDEEDDKNNFILIIEE